MQDHKDGDLDPAMPDLGNLVLWPVVARPIPPANHNIVPFRPKPPRPPAAPKAGLRADPTPETSHD